MPAAAINTTSAIPELVLSAVVAAITLMAPLWVTVALAARDRAVAIARRRAQIQQLQEARPELLERVEKLDRITMSVSVAARILVTDTWATVRGRIMRVLEAIDTDTVDGLSDDDIDVGWAAALRMPVVDTHLRLVLGMDDGLTDARMEALERLREDMRATGYDHPELAERLTTLLARAEGLTIDPHCPAFLPAYCKLLTDYGHLISPLTGATLRAPAGLDHAGDLKNLAPEKIRASSADTVTHQDPKWVLRTTTIASRAWLPGVGMGGIRPYIGSGGGGLASVRTTKKLRVTWTMTAVVWGVIMLALQIAAAVLFPDWGITGAITFTVTSIIVLLAAALDAHRRGLAAGSAGGPVKRELSIRMRDVVSSEITRIGMVLNDLDLLARSLTGGSADDPFFAEWKAIRARYDRDTQGFVELVDEGGNWQPKVRDAYRAISDMGNAETNLMELYRLTRGDEAVRRRHVRLLKNKARSLGDGEAVAVVAAELDSLDARPDAHDFMDTFTAAVVTLKEIDSGRSRTGETTTEPITSAAWSCEDMIVSRQLR
ncbi:hypothetical protein ACFSSC_02615 [Corynebacterium mendelii]|uniref:Uncharacterized protein n=1 Tax=Corynebacterium mendelii TaxID=2765362 RepID=A0A939E0F2_9CORY|nr:hypothetical protein [Corynebacterium mendelii]MBN9644171.1 hypothetical protein [Corynebacterium mendelii]